MYSWLAVLEGGERREGRASSVPEAREAALRASDHRGAVFVLDERGELIPWCSVDAYAGDGPQG